MPERFGSVEDTRALFAALMRWYNEVHYHSGIALLTPGDVHRGHFTKFIVPLLKLVDTHRYQPPKIARPVT